MNRLAACLCLLPLTALPPAVVHAQVVHAQEARDFCADRPGLGTPVCTLAPGAAMIELGVAGWDRSRSAETVEDDITLGDLLLRVGVTETTEVQLGLTSHVVRRSRDRATGNRSRVSGIGDGTIAIRRGLAGVGGELAVQVYATVPLAGPSIGSEGWSGGVLLPAAFALPAGIDLEITPRLAVAVDEDGRGRHLAWGGVVGLSRPLDERLAMTVEFGALRDEDPAEKSTDARVAMSLVWQFADRVQADFEVDAGLSRGAPDHAIAVGLAWQFR